MFIMEQGFRALEQVLQRKMDNSPNHHVIRERLSPQTLQILCKEVIAFEGAIISTEEDIRHCGILMNNATILNIGSVTFWNVNLRSIREEFLVKILKVTQSLIGLIEVQNITILFDLLESIRDHEVFCRYHKISTPMNKRISGYPSYGRSNIDCSCSESAPVLYIIDCKLTKQEYPDDFRPPHRSFRSLRHFSQVIFHFTSPNVLEYKMLNSLLRADIQAYAPDRPSTYCGLQRIVFSPDCLTDHQREKLRKFWMWWMSRYRRINSPRPVPDIRRPESTWQVCEEPGGSYFPNSMAPADFHVIHSRHRSRIHKSLIPIFVMERHSRFLRNAIPFIMQTPHCRLPLPRVGRSGFKF